MAEISLTEIIERLSIQQDSYGEREKEAIGQLLLACCTTEFLETVRQHADMLFSSDKLMPQMAYLLQEGFDERQLSDHDIYINPRGIPLNGAGSEIFVLFPEPMGRVMNHPGNIIGHYYGEGKICGHEGEVSLHGRMRADMDGVAKLRLFGESRAVLGGNANVELFDQSRVNPRDQVRVRLHDLSSAFLMDKDSACWIEADGFSHLIVQQGKHRIHLSDDVLFMDLTDSDMLIQDRCSGYKPKGNAKQAHSSTGLIWREPNMSIEVDFRNRIHSRRCRGEELSSQSPKSADRLEKAKELIGASARKASLSEEYHGMLDNAQSMDTMAVLLSTHIDVLLKNGLKMDKVKELFQPSELSAVRIYTGTEAVPEDIAGQYHVFDHLIVPQSSDQAFGIFHDHSIGIIKAGVSESDGMALTAGEGTATLKAGGHSTLLLRDASIGVTEGMALGFVTDYAQIKAKDYSIIEAGGNATVNAGGYTITKLNDTAVGSFSEAAMFVAANHSRYILAGEAKGVALQGENGSLPASLTVGKEVPKVDEWEARTFYTICLKERGEAIGAELRKENAVTIQRGR